MSARWLSLAVVVGAFTCYHLAQRSMPEGLRPAPLFAFVYRAGWSIGAANTTTQAIVTAILVVVGLVGFGEQLTATKLAGLAMCVVGGSLVVAR